MSRSAADGNERYVLADCAETGVTRCFAVIPPRVEYDKDPFRPRSRRRIVSYYPRYALKPIYTSDRGGDWSGLEKSPFWSSPRLVTREQIPEGVKIP